MDAGSTVAVLVGATELEGDVVLAVEMEKIVTLNEGVAKFGIRNTGAAFADAILDKLAIEELGHRKGFADFTKEAQIIDVFEPVVIVNHGDRIRINYALDLGFDAGFVVFYFVESFEIALAVVFWVTDLAGGAANEERRFIAVTHETSTHHESGEIADL